MPVFISPMPNANHVRLTAVVSALLLSAGASFAGIQTHVGYHADGMESPGFTFENVPPPSRNDAATEAKFSIISGQMDASGGDLDKLHDGKIPTEGDEPGENFFFAANTEGGRIEVDLNRAVALKQVNTYSWHPDSRAPQVYKLYASQGTVSDFNAKPGKDADLEKCGWTLITQVDTRSGGNKGGGQYGVSISDTDGAIGNYRYLLFDISSAENEDPFGNTFYSEIDVVEMNAPVEAVAAAAYTPPFIIKSTDGYCTIAIDSSKAPELKQWAEQKLGPALSEWYPKIVAMMSSDGFHAPKAFSVAIRPGDGVAATSGNRIGINSLWLDKEINGEGIGALLHEVVHVVQQYGGGRNGNRPPGWIVEGIPDYIRFFKCEPQIHGADNIWLQKRPKLVINYDGMYRISANFLNYVVTHYDPKEKLIEKVNAACRQGTYTDDLWKELTGKPLAELNDEWKASVRKDIAPKN